MSDKFLRLERGQAEIVPVQNTIFAAKTSAYLMPVVAVFVNETLLCFRELEIGVACFFSIGVDFVFLVFRSEGK